MVPHPENCPSLAPPTSSILWPPPAGQPAPQPVRLHGENQMLPCWSCNSIHLLLGFPLLCARVICKEITHSKLLHLCSYSNTPSSRQPSLSSTLWGTPCPNHLSPTHKSFLCQGGMLEFPQALARKYLNVIKWSSFVLFFPREINLSKVFNGFFCSSERQHQPARCKCSWLVKAKYFLLLCSWHRWYTCPIFSAHSNWILCFV